MNIAARLPIFAAQNALICGLANESNRNPVALSPSFGSIGSEYLNFLPSNISGICLGIVLTSMIMTYGSK